MYKGHLYEENINLYRKLAQGTTTAKAQGTTASAVGYFEACTRFQFVILSKS